jgi:histidinol-phosphatase (PHP family)
MDREIAPARLMDYHLHTAVTIDGNMSEIEACKRALEIGIQEIAFTNHVMLNQPDYLISQESFIKHWESIQVCKERYPQLQIRLGIEMDYYPNQDADIKAKIQFYEGLIGQPFDFILGSVHDIRGGFFSNKTKAINFFKDCDIVSIYHEYFKLAAQSAESHLFDIIAHPDLIKKFTYQLTPPLPFESYKSSVEPFITALISYGVGIEVNSKGLQLPVKETYPSREFLKLYLSKVNSLGAEPIITVGSDAHRVGELGFGIIEMIDTLKELHVNSLVSFNRREKSPFAI